MERREGPDSIDWEEVIDQARRRWSGRTPGSFRLLYVVPMVVIAIWLLTGTYQVGPGERGVVRQFGARRPGATGPGLHYHLPWPIQRVDVVDVETVRTAELGFRSSGRGEETGQAALLQGDPPAG